MFDGSGMWTGHGLSGVSVLPRKCGASAGAFDVMEAMAVLWKEGRKLLGSVIVTEQNKAGSTGDVILKIDERSGLRPHSAVELRRQPVDQKLSCECQYGEGGKG